MSDPVDLSHVPEADRQAYEKESEQRAGETHAAWSERARRLLEDLLHRHPRPATETAPPAPDLPYPPADSPGGAGTAAPESPAVSDPTAEPSPGGDQ